MLDRNTIYQRAKKETHTRPFGTQPDVNAGNYVWMVHSMALPDFHNINCNPRIIFDNKECSQPFSSSIFIINALCIGSTNTIEL